MKLTNLMPPPVQTQGNHRLPTRPNLLPISHALQIKSAELWLLLGEADQALRELEKLDSNGWNDVAALMLRGTALAMLQGSEVAA